jgi:hypothetical protein
MPLNGTITFIYTILATAVPPRLVNAKQVTSKVVEPIQLDANSG